MNLFDRNSGLLGEAPPQNRAEAKYQQILATMEDAFYEVDVRGNLVSFNSAFSRLLGYDKSELTGMNNRQYQTATAAADVYRIFNRVYQTGIPAERAQWEVTRKDGALVISEGSVQLVHGPDGKPVGFRGIVRDVTLHWKIEQAVRASEEKYRRILETTNEA